MKRPSVLIKAFIAIALTHIFLSLNVTYSTHANADDYYVGLSAQSIKGVNKDQYNQFINSLDKSQKAEAVANVRTTYFGVIPYWLRNVFFLCYVALIFLLYPNISPYIIKKPRYN